MNWYALYVRSGREELVWNVIKRRFSTDELVSIVPKRTVPEYRNGVFEYVNKVIFPGYILIKTILNKETYVNLKQLPNVIRPLIRNNNKIKSDMWEDDVFDISHISDEEISPLLTMLDQEAVVEASVVSVIDSKVFVKAGPLVGKEDQIKKIDCRKNRVNVELGFLGQKKDIQLGVKIIPLCGGKKQLE